MGTFLTETAIAGLYDPGTGYFTETASPRVPTRLLY